MSPTARAFYVDALGFDETASLGGSAVFVSAGGYHHHMAMNVWNSRGAGPRMPALGLGRVDLALPDADALGALAERLRHHGFAARDDGRTLAFDDPWNNAILATVGRALSAAPAARGLRPPRQAGTAGARGGRRRSVSERTGVERAATPSRGPRAPSRGS